ncbi:MAG: hypothetical protein CMJ29_13130 [Phycisphaerae bacterium]|nr:hypothetical protein [Phycisphaerae bacterium]|tara:strand:- start:115 stop:849 length:735 start_codon:yes stop_codon:yes gene_type:complete
MRSDDLRHVCIALASCLLMTATGCDLFERTSIENSAVVQFPANDEDFDFWDTLATQSVVTNDDALHGLLLLADGKDDCETYECRYEAGVQKGWFEGSWGGMPPANQSAKTGWIAVAGCRILEIKGGLTMQLFGDSPRYCSRELTFMGLLPAVSENEALTGLEFTAFVDNIEDRQRLDVALKAREALKKQQKELRRQQEAKRISEVLTPMHSGGVGGTEQSGEEPDSPDPDNAQESSDSPSEPSS